MLVLFDIDATLIKTRRAGLYAMQDAIDEFLGRKTDIEGIRFAGGLDPLIIRGILEANDHEMSADELPRIRARYGELLAERLAVPGTGFALPGVVELLRALRSLESITLGLLTGNFEETGKAKLEASGVDLSSFLVNAFGDESPHDPPHRRHLPPVAIERFEVHTGRPVPPEKVVVIGDTPHDVDCALANGCRALAVASGLNDRQELEDAGADLAVDDLTDTKAILDWIRARDAGSGRGSGLDLPSPS